MSYHSIINFIRSKVPLKARKVVGPILAYCVYFVNINFRKNRTIPKVLSISATIDLIIDKKLSVIRFGDGEMSLIQGGELAFQKRNLQLAQELKAILQSDHAGLLVCIPGIWGNMNHFSRRDFWFAMHHLFRYGHIWREILPKEKIFGDAFITRFHLRFVDKSQSEAYFRKLFSIWNNEDVILIEGEKSRLGVGNDMFDNVKSIKRILCPAENAYDKFETIMAEASKISKDDLVLISLGPTAKVLAYHLFLLGYRVIDVGHIDMEYEMFLKKENKITKVKYKYFNEICERNPEDCRDARYLDQIIVKIK